MARQNCAEKMTVMAQKLADVLRVRSIVLHRTVAVGTWGPRGRDSWLDG